MALMFELTMSPRREKMPMSGSPSGKGNEKVAQTGGNRKDDPGFNRHGPEIFVKIPEHAARMTGEEPVGGLGVAVRRLIGHPIVKGEVGHRWLPCGLWCSPVSQTIKAKGVPSAGWNP
jgi:hypothetical protein